MPLIGVTGGIATGKSSFVRALLRYLEAEVFDADRAAHALLADDPEIARQVENAFGRDVFDSTGRPDRRKLRELVFAEGLHRRRLEEILHPVIRARWADLAERKAVDGGWLVVDLPLLYETDAARRFDRVIVVACSSATQHRRLSIERGLDAQLARRIISAQLDLETKIKRADHLVWTDSTLTCLDRQAALIAGALRYRYG